MNYIIFILAYTLLPTIIVATLATLKNFIRKEIRRRMRIRDNGEPKKKSLISKVNEALKFTLLKDKRTTVGIPNKLIVIIIYLIGLGGVVAGVMAENMTLSLSMFIFPFLTWIAATFLYRPIKNKREVLYERLHSLKAGRMGLVDKVRKDGFVDYNKEFQIIEWEDNYITPKKIMITIPTKFDELSIPNFMEQFNLHFGAGTKFAPDRSTENPGWNFTEGQVILVRTPPLPKRAEWDEEYLFNDDIAWSFFPMALGSENGVKITDNEGKEKFVLGFDLAGEQAKMAKKKGVQIGEEVVLAPQVLIAGGTGGGKALSSDTPIITVKVEDE